MPDENRKESDLRRAVDYDPFLTCIHCGLCTSACPTYTEVWDENDGPRGRIHLMRAVLEGRAQPDRRLLTHLALCLDCRACEPACPSGVEYGRLIESFRLALAEAPDRGSRRFDWFRELFLRILPYPDRIRLALAPVRAMQQVGLFEFLEKLGFFDLLPAGLSEMATLVNPPPPPLPELPPIFAPAGSRRARVALFVGCVADAMFRPTHWATLRVLAANGCEVVVPRGQGCCGAIHHHSGDREGARRMADLNTDAFRPDDVDAIVVNHAGCGAMLKEYPIRWTDARTEARTRMASKVRDLSEFLAQLGPVPPAGRIEAVATYHDACHLGHAQNIRTQPRQLLELIPGLEVKPLPETEICCGSAGTYNLYQPEMARRLGRRKLDAIRSTGARIVLAANAGCLLHIGREIRRAEADLLLMHPIELLDYSYRRERPAGIGSPPASSV